MARYIDETTLEYPLELHEIKRRNPNKSIPQPPAEPEGYGIVHQAEQPSFDLMTQGIAEGVPQKVGGKWEQTWVLVDLPPEKVGANIVAAKNRLIEAATAKRWDVMTGGISLPGGMQVGTTIDDQNRITSVVANAALAGLTDEDEVDFKAASGWVKITIAEVKQIAGAIGQFVQACYSSERAHHEAIALLSTPAEINAYDVNDGWPDAYALT